MQKPLIQAQLLGTSSEYERTASARNVHKVAAWQGLWKRVTPAVRMTKGTSYGIMGQPNAAGQIMTKTINDFAEVTVEDLTFVNVISEGARNVDLLRSESQKKRKDGARDALLDSAFSASMQSLNALLAVSKMRCRRDAPPADIEAVTDTTGKLIYRCQHKSPHRWALDGTPL